MFMTMGHRGASGLAPENTLSSIFAAIERDVHLIELDVQMCRTGELILHHDLTVDRMTNGRGMVRNLSFDDLKRLKVRSDSVLSLSEALRVVKGPVALDIKSHGTGTALAEFLVKQGHVHDQMYVSSRMKNELLAVRKVCPSIRLGLVTFGIDPRGIRWAKQNKVSFISVPDVAICRPYIDACHRHGMKVFAYPFGHRKAMKTEKLQKLGVDGAFFNYPGKAPK